jgi:hypothetical protein
MVCRLLANMAGMNGSQHRYLNALLPICLLVPGPKAIFAYLYAYTEDISYRPIIQTHTQGSVSYTEGERFGGDWPLPTLSLSAHP